MNYLAIDTSGTHLTVIACGNKKSVRFLPDCRLNHSVVLMDEIEKALLEAQITSDQIDVFACAVGPGSFTGIRIGVSTVKAFAYAHSKKVLPVTSFSSLAYYVKEKCSKLTLIDAGHDNFYACGYNCEGDIDIPPCFIAREDIPNYAETRKIICQYPSGFEGEIIADFCDGFNLAVEQNLNEAKCDVESVVPLYIRKSQAEENAK